MGRWYTSLKRKKKKKARKDCQLFLAGGRQPKAAVGRDSNININHELFVESPLCGQMLNKEKSSFPGDSALLFCLHWARTIQKKMNFHGHLRAPNELKWRLVLCFFFFNVLSWVLLDAGRACQEIREPEACRSWLIPMGSGWRETWGSQQPIVQINLGLRWPYVVSLCPCHFEPWISLGNLWEMLKTVHLEEGNEYLTRRWEIPQQEMLGVFGR